MSHYLSEDIGDFVNHGFLARHETFYPRYGWLKKGFEGVLKDPLVFDRKDSIEILGVGLNMVKSIRFWCLAFGVIETVQKNGQRRLSGPMEVTEFGRNLISDDGWDPYLEDLGSLWLLHWMLFSLPITASAWSMIMNLGFLLSFSPSELKEALAELVKKHLPSRSYTLGSIGSDAACFIRMYSASKREVLEEIDSPFTQLKLLQEDSLHHRFYFNVNEKISLPDLVFMACCLDYANQYQPHLRTISLNKLSYGFNSPGVVCKLSETDIGHRLERVTNDFDGIRFLDLFGVRQIQFDEDPWRLRDRALSLYYRGTRIVSQIDNPC